jgi:exonuclease VII small subunit
MKRLEEAARRLEQAVTRLEQATARGGNGSSEARRLATALAEARAQNGALAETTAQVAGRLDAAIARLNAALGP